MSASTLNDKLLRVLSMNSLKDRLVKAMAEKEGSRKIDLARAAGVTTGAVAQWFSGKTQALKGGPASGAAHYLGVTTLWLTEGIGPMRQKQEVIEKKEINPDEEFQAVKRVMFKLSAGVSGFSIDVEGGETQPIFFRKDWFVRHRFSPDKMFAVRINGDSMVPSLYDGDLVVVNTADQRPRDGEVFAANYEGELVIKRVRLDGGSCWLDSDAADQIRFRPRQCGEGCFIIGRVVYKQSERI